MSGPTEPDDKQKRPKTLDEWPDRGASLLKPCRPVPSYVPRGRFPAQVCGISADRRQKTCRPAPKTRQACANNTACPQYLQQDCHRSPAARRRLARDVSGITSARRPDGGWHGMFPASQQPGGQTEVGTGCFRHHSSPAARRRLARAVSGLTASSRDSPSGET